jgi:SSS family solute:Na+ symporter/sodium/proline symporter
MDLFIGLLATTTLCVALPTLIHIIGGWSVVRHALPATHFQLFGDISPIRALELFLPTCLLLLGNQSMYQKFFSAKSEKAASRAVIGWIVGTVILETVIVALAVTGSALYPTGEVSQSPREILAYIGLHAFDPAPAATVTLSSTGAVASYATTAAPAVSLTHLYLLHLLGALLVGAIFAKVISTANNWLFSPATNLVNDIYVRYISVVLLGIWALYQGLYASSVLKMALYAYTIYGAGLTPVILAAFFWRRVTAAAAVASIAAGTLITVSWDFLTPHLPSSIAHRDAIFPALIVSVLSLALVSLFTTPPTAAQLVPFGEA